MYAYSVQNIVKVSAIKLDILLDAYNADSFFPSILNKIEKNLYHKSMYMRITTKITLSCLI